MPLSFTFANKIPGPLPNGEFGISLSRIFAGPSTLNPVGIIAGNPVFFGLVGPFAQLSFANTDTPPFWVGTKRLSGSDTQLSDSFGSSVDGNSNGVGVVGAPVADLNSAGAAYVFNTSVAPFVQTQKLTNSDAAAGDGFGGSVSIDGNLMAIGADQKNGNQGAVYIFQFNGTTWVQIQKLLPGDVAAGDLFGSTVFLLGNNLFVDARNQTAGAGSVYWFVFNGAAFVQQQKLPGLIPGSNFGTSIAYDTLNLLIGAPITGTGRAYVYQLNASNQFVLVTTLVGSDSVSGDQFGTSVATNTNDTTMAIGARANAVNGAVYLFSNFIQYQKIVQTDASGGDLFGETVALFVGPSISWLAVGAPFNIGDEGAVYFFSGPGDPSSSTPHSQLIFQGVRRNPGSMAPPKYKYRPKTYVYQPQISITTLSVVGGVLAPVQVIEQQITDYDFDLYQIIITYDGPTGPISQTIPLTKLWIYDVNRFQISNLPVLDLYLNGGPSSKYRNGALVPPLLYPKDSSIRIEVTNLVTNSSLLPLTMTVNLVGRQRIPC